MRILFDARSVQTAAGAYVFGGLSSGWLQDARVSAVLAAVRPGFDESMLPANVEPLRLPNVGWLQHIGKVLPELADAVKADFIFVPNGLPPADSRAVVYFQDHHHFHALSAPGLSPRVRVLELLRAYLRRRNAPACRLAVPVSTDIHREVVRRLSIPIVMIPNGVDVGATRWVEGGDAVVVLGGNGTRKGELDAIKAWALLGPDVRRGHRLHLIGVQPDARADELREAARQLIGDDSVEVVGALPRSQYLQRIAHSALAVSCSRLEAFGLPVAESLAMGSPVLASDLPSHRELMARAGAGDSFPAGNVHALAAALGRVLAGDGPARLKAPPVGWSWQERARQHIDAYQASN